MPMDLYVAMRRVRHVVVSNKMHRQALPIIPGHE